MRNSSKERNTKETQIKLSIDLDNYVESNINTGVGFFDHMLTLLAFHGKFTLNVEAKGDLYVDDHHLVEDTGILLGQAFKEALLDKKGINRYGSARVVMDEALAVVDLDLSNRGYLVYNVTLNRNDINGFSLEMVKEFMYAFAINSGTTLHINLMYGDNDHHKVEAIFKALGQALKKAVCIVDDRLPSTKGKI
ncbi:MAG: imidazoleglycerol-phosphate dehydratase HisB [Erysipelotrichaceae bacterium]|jgi:imidazoleglycerol-phosphate dehydratase|nr:imidazoleglycerol-phosphate dehydratase HisB [Erysipelotrichaceae bacterium]